MALVAQPLNPYGLCLTWLARRELSESQIRRRLQAREVPAGVLEEVVLRLRRAGAVDDLRTARACARTHALVKHRGPHRVARELDALGIDRTIAAEALHEVFDQTDEQDLIARLLDRRLARQQRVIPDRAEYRRLYGYLLRQGFTASAVRAVLHARTRRSATPEEE